MGPSTVSPTLQQPVDPGAGRALSADPRLHPLGCQLAQGARGQGARPTLVSKVAFLREFSASL